MKTEWKGRIVQIRALTRRDRLAQREARFEIGDLRIEIARLSQGGMAGLDCPFQGEMRLAVWFRGRCPRL